MFIWNALVGKPSDPNKPPINSQSDYQDVLNLAQKLSQSHLEAFDDGQPMSDSDQRDLQRAALLFDDLAEARPVNIGNYIGAGKCYQAIGKDTEAIRRFQQGLATVPPDPIPAILDTAIETHYLLSVSFFNVHDNDASLKEVNTAINLYGRVSPIYLAQRANIYIQQKKYKEANDDLMKGLQVDPEHKKSKALLKLLLLGAGDQLQAVAAKKLTAKDYKGAIADCTQGLKIIADDPPLLAIRAAAYFDLGDKAKAREDLNRLKIVAPDSKDVQVLQKLLK
jgi:tetratricopeptide (TPR) repeat protein